MQLTNCAFEFIETLDRQNDVASLVRAFQELIGKYGMSCFAIGDLTQPKVRREDRLSAATWPQNWLEHWHSRNYISADPVVYRLLRRNEPLRWKTVLSAGDFNGARIFEEAAAFGMGDGYALPIYSRDGLVVGISMATDRYALGKQDEASLHMASIYFYAKLEELLPVQLPRVQESKLTPRERECLSWVASGKTDWEISQILNIAEQTVHEYVQNALIKLNATTRAQAVATAIFTKQIAL